MVDINANPPEVPQGPPDGLLPLPFWAAPGTISYELLKSIKQQMQEGLIS